MRLWLATVGVLVGCGAPPLVTDAGRVWPVACGLAREQTQPARVRLLDGLEAATTETACRIGAGTDTYLFERASGSRLVSASVSREAFFDGGGIFVLSLGLDGGASTATEVAAGASSVRLWAVAPPALQVGATVTGTSSSVGGYGVTLGSTPLFAVASGPTQQEAVDAPAGLLRFRALSHAGVVMAFSDAGCEVDAGFSWVRVMLDAGTHSVSRLSQPAQLKYELLVREGPRELARLTDRSAVEDTFISDGGSLFVGFGARHVPACGQGAAPAAILEAVDVWLR
jgi:hypothetical protein